MEKDCLFQTYVSSLCFRCGFKQIECEGFLRKAEALENLLSDNYPILEIKVKTIECNKFRTRRDIRNCEFEIKKLEREKVRLEREKVRLDKKKQKQKIQLQLTDAERKVLELRDSGLVYREISKNLGISFQMANYYFRRAQEKLEGTQLLS